MDRVGASFFTPVFQVEQPTQQRNPHLWTKEKIAELLWEDPSTLIDEHIVAKVNIASEYLSRTGYCLGGVKSDGNCFFTAFYESYRLLNRKITLIEDEVANDPIRFLRKNLADIIKHKNVEESQRIQNSGAWVSIEVGKQLLNHFQIPLRVLTADADQNGGQGGVFDTLIKEDLKEYPWDQFPDNDLPQEYIFIVDLGGHFLFAKSGKCINATVSEVKTNNHALANRGPYRSDIAQASLFQHEKKKSNSQPKIDVAAVNPEDIQRFSLQLCQDLDNEDPALLYHLIDQLNLPKTASTHYKGRALKQLTRRASEDVQQAIQNNMEGDQLANLMEIQENLKIEQQQSVNEEKNLVRELKEISKNYFVFALSFLFDNPEEERVGQFFDLFEQLKDKLPFSLEPYYPFLTFLAARMDPDSLETLLKESQNRDYHLTYAMALSFFYLMSRGKNTFFIPEAETAGVLKALYKVYPEDAVLPALIECIGLRSDGFEIIIKGIIEAFEIAFQSLCSHNTQQAVEVLLRLNPLLPGYSILQRYLSLSWAMHGNFLQAKRIFERSKTLIEIEKLLPSEHLMKKIEGVFNNFHNSGDVKSKAVGATPNLSDPLNAFISMAEKEPLDIDLAVAFIQASVSALDKSVEDLPFIYLGIRNIASRLSSKEGLFDQLYRPLFNSLFELIVLTAGIHDRWNEIRDPWFDDHFKKLVKGDNFSYRIDFSSIHWGLNSSQSEEMPIFELTGGNCTLSSKAVDSLALSITKKSYSLILGLMCSNLIARKDTLFSNLPLPDDPTLFRAILDKGLTSKKTTKYEQAVNYLRSYLEIDLNQRPYPIDSEYLNWAKFCYFVSEAPPEHKTSFSYEIIGSFYPNTFSTEGFGKRLQLTLKLKPFLFIDETSSTVHLSLRDVLIAEESLKARSNREIISIHSCNNIYSIFDISKRLFGWQLNESFTEWGERLLAYEKTKIFGSDTEFIGNSEEIYRNDGIAVFEGALDYKTRRSLGFFLQFWIQFHSNTCSKNEYIAKGGEEDDTGKHGKAWNSKMSDKEWLSIISKNSPDGYPDYNKLSKEDKIQLAQVIQKKHDHSADVVKLQALCKRPNYIDVDEFILILSAALIENGEAERKKVHHSVFVKSEAEAIRLYQILLEVSLDRLFRRAVMLGGAEGWINIEQQSISQRLAPFLSMLEGKFHGPERHLTGDAPIEYHYNAGIITKKLTSTNVHIFFQS